MGSKALVVGWLKRARERGCNSTKSGCGWGATFSLNTTSALPSAHPFSPAAFSLPAALLNAPASHAVHVALALPSNTACEALPSNPSTHAQARRDVLPGGEVLCGGHGEHASLPVPNLKDPGTHGTQ